LTPRQRRSFADKSNGPPVGRQKPIEAGSTNIEIVMATSNTQECIVVAFIFHRIGFRSIDERSRDTGRDSAYFPAISRNRKTVGSHAEAWEPLRRGLIG